MVKRIMVKRGRLIPDMEKEGYYHPITFAREEKRYTWHCATCNEEYYWQHEARNCYREHKLEKWRKEVLPKLLEKERLEKERLKKKREEEKARRKEARRKADVYRKTHEKECYAEKEEFYRLYEEGKITEEEVDKRRKKWVEKYWGD